MNEQKGGMCAKHFDYHTDVMQGHWGAKLAGS